MEISEDVTSSPLFLYDNSRLEDDVEETGNGLYLNNVYIPEEIILHILEEEFAHWYILENGGDGCIIENPPLPLPLRIPEFHNQTSSFTTSYGKHWKIYKPHIYLSEWTASSIHCGCIYKLQCGFVRSEPCEKYLNKPVAVHCVNKGKIEIVITEYPEDIEELIFKHEGRDTQYWAGHYGSKMAGGVLKLLFDSIEPLPTDENV
ncbi:hypothetical protein ILUMI_14187 [Ignelater luminosus]|uniref:FBA domain-containing protein n=1 Tax=Ignelater luminosus TaxID=2038154 RepID=A0A8K0CVC2_IGNLU|nr:hypothetical protein ILUMI_14187 [Ignelater luminosus]